MLSYRRAVAPDVPVLAELWHAMLVECDLVGSGLLPDWRERLENHFIAEIERESAAWFVAEDGGRIAGTGAAFLSAGRSNVLRDLSAMLAGVYVVPQYRRRGIARRLTLDLIEWCREQGCVRVRLHASAAGRPMYESLGFVTADEMMRLDL